MNIGDNVTAASNTTITIRCPVNGVPTPSVTWTKDGVDIDLEDKISIKDDNSLVIKQSNENDSAKYSCRVHNNFGINAVSSIVSVKGKLCVNCSLLEDSMLLNGAQSKRDGLGRAGERRSCYVLCKI